MSYVKTGLGLDPAFATVATVVQPGEFKPSHPPIPGLSFAQLQAMTPAQKAAAALQFCGPPPAFIVGMTGPSGQPELTRCSGGVTVTHTPPSEQAQEARIRASLVGVVAGDNDQYRLWVCKARGNPLVQREMDRVGLPWKLKGENVATQVPIPSRQLMECRLFLKHGRNKETLLRMGVSPLKVNNVLRAAPTPQQYAWMAKDFQDRTPASKGVAEHRASVIVPQCVSAGIPPEFMPCCAQFMQKRGATIGEFQRKLEKRDPEIMACLQSAQAAAVQEQEARNRRKLILFSALGAAGLVAVALLKKKRKPA